MNGTYISGTDPYLWFVYGQGSIGYSWGQFFSGGAYQSSQWLTIGRHANAAPGELPYINLSSQTAQIDSRAEDRVTFDTDGDHQVILKNVEYVDATLGTTADLHQYGHFGFTSDASLDSIYADVGNHNMQFTTAIKYNSLHLGDGWDTVTLADHLDIPGTQYWSLIRRADGQMDAYSLLTGYRIRMEDGAESRNGTFGVRNFGEVEQIFLKNAQNGETVTINPGGGDLPHASDRGLATNINLRSDGQTFSDSFNLAGFNFIRYTSDNVWTGEAAVHDGVSFSTPGNHTVAGAPVLSGQLSVLGASRNGTHDLIVAEQATGQAIDGLLRVYAFDTNSGLYNEFNQIYLGTADNDASDKSSVTGTVWSDRVALYGFGGEDVLKGGAGQDYIFGGQSTYNQLVTGDTGNQVTGGTGADYFGVGNTNSAGIVTGSNTTIGTVATGTFLQGYATDVIMDWYAGQDTLVVLSNGVAVLAGLRDGSGLVNLSGANLIDFRDYAAIATSDQDGDGARGGDGWDATQTLDYIYANQSTRDANSITNEADRTVVNNGLIVARGLAGDDTVHGSAGNDYLYGNAAANLIVLSEGGSDRVYYDTFDAARSRQYVSDFDTSNDQFHLNKRVIDAFGGNIARALTTADVGGSYTQAAAYNPNINFMHDVFYAPSILDTNRNHDTEDGTAPGLLSGSDGTTFTIGVGMAAVGYALMAIPFVGPALGAPLIISGGLLSTVSVVVGTQEHINATYSGNVGNYLNVISGDTLQAAGNTLVATNSAMWDSNVRFLDFFGGSDAGDGYIPVVEFTANTSGGIYGYFALHSTTETFVFLVASRDNLVENGEAIKVAEINGLLTADDFKIYDGEADIYNVGTEAPIVLLDPTVSSVKDGSNDQGMPDKLIDDVSGAVQITVDISGAVAGGSYLKVYDKTTLIYDGNQATAVNANVSATLTGNTFTVTDARSLGTVATQTDVNALTGDNTFVLRDSVVNYSVEFVDGTTGIPTRDGSGSITITGGNATVDGQGGSDTLSVTGTSSWLNGASNTQLTGIETIFVAAADTNKDGSITAADDLVTVNLSAQNDGFTVYGSTNADSIRSSLGNDTIFGLGGQDTINLGDGGADRISFAYSDAALGADTGFDIMIGVSDNDEIHVVAPGFADTDNNPLTPDVAVPGFADRDGDTGRLLYETATLNAERTLSSATELLVVSDSLVATTGDLTNNIAAALDSAFALGGLDGDAPSATTGGAGDSSVLFAVQSSTGSYYVGRYEDRGNDDTIAANDIEVFAGVSANNILESFWLPTVRAPQDMTMTLPADTGPTEAAGSRYYTQNLEVTVSGLAADHYLVFSLDGGSNWVFNAQGDNTFNLSDNTAYNVGQIIVRGYDAAGYAAPTVGSSMSTLPAGNYSAETVANTRAVTTDNIAPLAPAAPDLAATDDDGASTTDNITTLTSGLTFSGTTSANAIVKIYSGATLKSTVTADGSGNYSADLSLANGLNHITAQASDEAGNFSSASSELTVLVSYQDISSGASLGITTGAVQVNNTNFAGVETVDSTIYVNPNLTTTDTVLRTGVFNTSDDVALQYGLVILHDAWVGGGETVVYDVSAAANVISTVTVNSAWQNASAFFMYEGKVAVGSTSWSDVNRAVLWYWQDGGDGIAQTSELTLVADRYDLAEPSLGDLRYVADVL